MPNVMTEIINWANGLVFWEQVALDRILAGEAITDAVVAELVDLLLEDAGLQERTRQRPGLTHLASCPDTAINGAGRYRLARIHHLENINALAPNQCLEFGPALTVIYGENGSGKSGYARVIGSAAFTRGDQTILGNVMASGADSGTKCADIDLVDDDSGETLSIHYVVGQPCPQLRSFYVFDSTSVRNHLTRENPMSFSPAGLEVLTTLASIGYANSLMIGLRLEAPRKTRLPCFSPATHR